MTAEEYVTRFNEAVRSGDFEDFVTTNFHPDATMAFVGPPAGPFHGRDKIAEAYAADPPTDTLTLESVRTVAETEEIAFRWSQGDTGTMRIRRQDDLIVALTVVFDE
jgi:steroid delta-isomerase